MTSPAPTPAEFAALFRTAYPSVPGIPDPHARQAREEAEAAKTLDAILNRKDPR